VAAASNKHAATDATRPPTPIAAASAAVETTLSLPAEAMAVAPALASMTAIVTYPESQLVGNGLHSFHG